MRWLYFIALLLFAAGAAAQARIITGTVRDAQGMPVPFASVTEAGTRNTVSADANGNFSIRISTTSARLEISASGFTSTTINVQGNTANAILTRQSGALENVVVTTSLGIRTQSKELGYAATSLNGRVSGLLVTGEEQEESTKLKTWKRSGLDENSVKLTVGDKDTLKLRAAQVAVVIDGFRARVLFDFYYVSDRRGRLRGNFRLKLPAGASPFYFAFGGRELLNNEKGRQRIPFVAYTPAMPLTLAKDSVRKPRMSLREARVVPKAKASYAFNEVVRGNVDPALAEWAGADVFSCALFPIEQGKLQHVVIGYDINLLQSGSEALLELNLPFPEVRRQVDISIADAGARRIELSAPLPGRALPGYRRYHSESFTEKSLSISVGTPASVLLQSAAAERYFALSGLAQLEGQALPNNETAVFLLDVSWSSQPDKFNIWLKTMEAVLRGNRDRIKQFAVLCFHVDAFWWKKNYVANTERNLRSFLRYAGGLSLVGATDLGKALGEAAAPSWPASSKEPRNLFLLSDGDVSWGEQNLYALSQKVRGQDRIYSFVTGLSGTDTRILNHLSRESGGAVFSVLNEDELTEAARSLRYAPWYIESVSAPGCRDLLLSGRPNALFPGQKILVTGRGIPAGAGSVEIRLRCGSVTKTLQIEPEANVASELARRIYGQIAVQQLSAFGFDTRTAADRFAAWFDVPDENHSFVMLESAALYRRFGIDSTSFAAFVDSSEVSDLVARVLEQAARKGQMGSARKVFTDWLQQLRADSLLPMQNDGLLDRALATLPDSAFEVPIPALHSRNVQRRQWMHNTLQVLDKGAIDYQQLLRQVQSEKEEAGAPEAFALMTTIAESNREDITLLRDLAFQLEQWRLSGQAYQLLAQLLRARPAEPATWGLLAANLRKLSRPALAIAYYDIAYRTDWDRRFDGFDLILAMDYFRLLQDKKQMAETGLPEFFIEARRRELQAFLSIHGVKALEADLMVVITWNTDNTDVDLHLREASGEECYYGYTRTSSGGFLSNDATDGFGPEMYYLEQAPAGDYHIDLVYYSDSRVQTAATSKILVHAYKNWGRPNEERFEKVVELRPKKKKTAAAGAEEDGDDDDDQLLKDVLVIRF